MTLTFGLVSCNFVTIFVTVILVDVNRFQPQSSLVTELHIVNLIARRSYASAVLGVVILRLTHASFVTNKQCTADILIPHERVITLDF